MWSFDNIEYIYIENIDMKKIQICVLDFQQKKIKQVLVPSGITLICANVDSFFNLHHRGFGNNIRIKNIVKYYLSQKTCCMTYFLMEML